MDKDTLEHQKEKAGRHPTEPDEEFDDGSSYKSGMSSKVPHNRSIHE